MALNFEILLIFAALLTGLITLLSFPKQFKYCALLANTTLCAHARQFFPVLVLVILVRNFLIQPFHVVSGSLEPTIKTGDLIMLNRFNYGLRAPITNRSFFSISHPKRGDIVLFHWPVDRSIFFIKRVVGIPGDHLSYINKVLYINGKPATQKMISVTLYGDNAQRKWPVNLIEETIDNVKHNIYLCSDATPLCPNSVTQNFYDLIVPAGQYFMMGDNRDDSEDSRAWGFVPDKDIMGKAMFVWFNLHPTRYSIDWHRIGIGL